MQHVKPVILVVVAVCTVLLLGWQPQPAEAQTACCRIFSNGAAIFAESFRCNTSSAETRRLALGTYEVDFTPVSTDIRPFVRLATVDSQSTGTGTAEISAVDRSGDTSSLFIQTRSNTGALVDIGFNVCLF
jgi:hypothetical protein